MVNEFESLVHENYRLRKKLKKNNRKNERDDELRPQYDLHQLLKDGVRGKYAARYRAGINLVLLAPDVAKAFANDAKAVNDALRLVIQWTKLPLGKKQLQVKP
jgi:hypothetical protein